MFDDSNIRLNPDKAFNLNNKCVDMNEFFSNYMLLSQEEESQFLSSLTDENIIEI